MSNNLRAKGKGTPTDSPEMYSPYSVMEVGTLEIRVFFLASGFHLSALSPHFLCVTKRDLFPRFLNSKAEIQKPTRFSPPSLTIITQQSCYSAIYALRDTCATSVVSCGFAPMVRVSPLFSLPSLLCIQSSSW